MTPKRPPRTRQTTRSSLPKDSAFTIQAEAGFDAAGVWVIRVTAEFRDGQPPEGSDLLGEARLQALLAITQAGLEGRKLGATTARVFLDLGDGPRLIEPGLDSTTLH